MNFDDKTPSLWTEIRMFIAEQIIGLGQRIMPVDHPHDAIWQECIWLAATRIKASLPPDPKSTKDRWL